MPQRFRFLKPFGILLQTPRGLLETSKRFSLFYFSGFHIIFVFIPENLSTSALFSLKKANFAPYKYDNEQKLHNNSLVRLLVCTPLC